MEGKVNLKVEFDLQQSYWVLEAQSVKAANAFNQAYLRQKGCEFKSHQKLIFYFQSCIIYS